MNVFKILFTGPIFFGVAVKIQLKFRKKIRKPEKFDEKSGYLGVKRYSRYLLGISDYRIDRSIQGLGDNQSTFIIVKDAQLLTALALLRINDFKIHAPITLLGTKSTSKKSSLIGKFLHLINDFEIEHLTKATLDKAVENLKIPRTMIMLMTDSGKTDFQGLDIPYGGLAKMIILEVDKNQKKFRLIENHSFTSKELIKINRQFIIKKIT